MWWVEFFRRRLFIELSLRRFFSRLNRSSFFLVSNRLCGCEGCNCDEWSCGWCEGVSWACGEVGVPSRDCEAVLLIF